MGAVIDFKTKILSYLNKNNEVVNVEANYQQTLDEIKTDNNGINTIFDLVDDGDGVIEAEELNMLNKIVIYIDSLKKKTQNNNILDTEEIEKFARKLSHNRINLSKILDTNTDSQNWSEGLDRNISTIKVAKNSRSYFMPIIVKELKEIGEEQGFNIEEIESGNDAWIEDSSIRRHDGKIYVPYHIISHDVVKNMYKNQFSSERGNANVGGQGRVAKYGYGFNLDIKNKDKIYGVSYLEGGNVLNTTNLDGSATAIVGQSSIGATLEILNLENTPENVEQVKEYIAKDLGLEKDKITFIPQFDFHIDMLYRPLKDGCVAVPDFEEGIKILTKLKTDIETNNQQYQDLDIETIDKRIEKLKELAESTKETRIEAEDYLREDGYEIVKIPYFSIANYDKTNFMNGVGGTSEKTGQKFYITNKSKYPILESIVEKYLVKAGIDKVYFISSTEALRFQGGIDCLTQEC